MKVYQQARRRYFPPAKFIAMVRGQLALHGITHAELGQRAGYSASSMSRWFTTNENVRVDPTLETMLVLDEALDQILEEL